MKKFCQAMRLVCFLVAMFGVSVLATVPLYYVYLSSPWLQTWMAELVCLTAFLMISPAQRILNRFVALVFPAPPIKHLDLGTLPAGEWVTAIAVPAVLADVSTVHELADALERHHLSTNHPNFRYVLLSDFPDSYTPTRESDDLLLEQLAARIRQLNAQYADKGANFYLFHRPRQWAPKQGLWMGWERKRGKLVEFNRFLVSGCQEGFSVIEGETKVLLGAKYVITLDADTRLSPGAASKLVGAIAHPENRAVIDPVSETVMTGYGVFQPNMQPRFNREEVTIGQWISLKLTPATANHAVDADQGLYGTSAFFGKGIYDVAVFDRTVGRRFPDDLILSHDLLEGCFARCAPLPDVTLSESVPMSIISEFKRKHRWVRGDWQSLFWALPFVPTHARSWVRNPLSWLSRWRIIDNIRRTCWSPCLLILILVLMYAANPQAIIMVALLVFVAPGVVEDLQISQGSFTKTIFHFAQVVLRRVYECVSALIWLPTEAVVVCHAIVTSITRLAISKRNQLAWVTSDLTEKLTRQGPASYVGSMAAGPATGALVLFAYPSDSSVATVIIAWLWISSPYLAWLLAKRREMLFVAVGRNNS